MEEDGCQDSYDWIHPPAGESEFELWDAEDIHAMGKMWQAEDVGVLAADGYYKPALEQITARVMVMPSQMDRYFVVDDGEPEAKNLKNGKFNPLRLSGDILEEEGLMKLILSGWTEKYLSS
jgi:homoserine acetyltransferase